MKRAPLGNAILAAAALAVTFALPAQAQLTMPRVSPGAKVTQTVGTTDFTVVYSRPGVKARTIWGELVPYGKVWRAGANEATTFTTTDPIQFGGKPLAAGAYELFILPGRDEWQVIVSDTTGQWGAFTYDSTKDVMRVPVRPTSVDPSQEWMEFSFEDMTPGSLTVGPSSTNLVLRWEKLQIAVPIVVDVNGKVLAQARTAMTSLKKDDWRTPYQAANFCLMNKVALEEGHQWLEKSLGTQENYSNLGLKARWQMNEGHKDEAIKTAEKAIELAKASKDKPDTAPLEKLLAEWKAGKS
jgi:hypothetical protein